MSNYIRYLLLTIVIIVFTSLCLKPHISMVESTFDVDIISEKLKYKLIPLKTTQAGNGIDDLLPLKKVLKDVHIVGMGEATHGTKEFFEMKHRMFEFLVEEMGYRAFAMEAGFGSHDTINNYILHGKGNISTVMQALQYWVWYTKEVADLINWMKEYNEHAKAEDKIRFYGFDLQEANSSIQSIREYLRKVDIDSEYYSKLNTLRASSGNRDGAKALLDELEHAFELNKNDYVQNSSLEEYELMLRHLKVIGQNIEYNEIISKESVVSADAFNASSNLRDSYMAENIKWIYEFEKQHYNNNKIMLWAHNGHIAYQHDFITFMGELLKDEFKEKYYALGFEFYDGSFVTIGTNSGKSMDIGVIEINEPKANIFGAYFANIFGAYFKETGHPISFLNFQTVALDQELLAWLSQEHPMYMIGESLYKNMELSIGVPIKKYDGMIFIESTNAAVNFGNHSLPIVQPIPTDEKSHKLTWIVSIVIILSLVILGILWKRRKAQK